MIKCKKCGSTEYYIDCRVSGISRLRVNTNGEESDNSSMYEGLKYSKPKKAYCEKCNSYFGKVEKLENSSRDRIDTIQQ